MRISTRFLRTFLLTAFVGSGVLTACSKAPEAPSTAEGVAEHLSERLIADTAEQLKKSEDWARTTCVAGAVKKMLPAKPLLASSVELPYWSPNKKPSAQDHQYLRLSESTNTDIKLPDGQFMLSAPYGSIFPGVYAVSEKSTKTLYGFDRKVTLDGVALQITVTQDKAVVAFMESPYSMEHGDCSSRPNFLEGWGEREFMRDVFGANPAGVSGARLDVMPQWDFELADASTETTSRTIDELVTKMSAPPGCPATVGALRPVAPYNAMYAFRKAEDGLTRDRSMLSFKTDELGWVDWRPAGYASGFGNAFCAGDKAYSLVLANMGGYLLQFDPATGALIGQRRVPTPTFHEAAAVSLATESVEPKGDGFVVKFSAYHSRSLDTQVDSVYSRNVLPLGSFTLSTKAAAMVTPTAR